MQIHACIQQRKLTSFGYLSSHQNLHSGVEIRWKFGAINGPNLLVCDDTKMLREVEWNGLTRRRQQMTSHDLCILILYMYLD